MNKPKLSADFTMDDLHALREYNSLRHIKMTTEEINDDIGKGASEMKKLIEHVRKERQRSIAV